MDEALGAGGADAVCICTENASHELFIQRALAAGKHVCVEYPVALGLEAAHSLFALADSVKCVLHVEHIELLSASYRALRDEVLGHAAPCKRAEIGFAGPLLPEGGGWLGIAGIARLHRIRDMFGEELEVRDFMWLQGVGAAADREHPDAAKAASLSVTFRTATGTDVLWTEWRSPGLGRANTVNFKFTDGHVVDTMPKVPNGLPLFLADLEMFLQKLHGERDRAEYRDAIMWCLAMATVLRAMSISSPMWHWSDRGKVPIPTATQALGIICKHEAEQGEG